MNVITPISVQGCDHQIIQRGDYYVLVARDMFTTGVYTCNEAGIIIPPSNRLLITHLTYEENFVCYRHVVGKMKCKKERYFGDGSKPGVYFGAKDNRICHKMELRDELKTYDDDKETESTYVPDADYMEKDGYNIKHMKTAREKFNDYIEELQMKFVRKTDTMKMKWHFTMRVFGSDNGCFLHTLQTMGTPNLPQMVSIIQKQKIYFVEDQDGIVYPEDKHSWDNTRFVLVLGNGQIAFGDSSTKHHSINYMILKKDETRDALIPHITQSSCGIAVTVTHPIAATDPFDMETLESYLRDIMASNSKVSTPNRTIRYLVDVHRHAIVTFNLD